MKVRMWLPVLLFISMFTWSHPLYRYDSEFYNSLTTPEVASSKLSKSTGFEHFLKESFSAIEQQKIPIKFRLLHKHDSVTPTQGMVERFEPLFSLLNAPAYVTSPTDLIQGQSTFKTNKGENVYPASWALSSDNLFQVFEFTTDEKVKKDIDQLERTSDILYQLEKLIIKYDVKELIAIAVGSRSQFPSDQVISYLERQYPLYGSVVEGIVNKESLPDATSLIRTSWELGPCNDACVSVIADYCYKEANGSHWSCSSSHCVQ